MLGERPSAALLPLPDERARLRVVDHGGTRGGEGETPTGALGATPDRPRAGRATALTDRKAESDESRAAGFAERDARTRADSATLRQEQVEHGVRVAN